MASPGRRIGGNLILSTFLALLSYVPFEYVAKGSLLLCVALFIFDPIPPVTRLLALLSTFVVGFLSKRYTAWVEEDERLQAEHEAMEAFEDDKKKRK